MSGRVLTMDEAAAELRVSRRWLQEFLQTLPKGRAWYLAAGNRKLFDASDLERLKDQMRWRSVSKSRARGKARTGQSEDHTSGSELIEAQKLLTELRRKRPSTRSKPKSNVVSFPTSPSTPQHLRERS